MAGSLPPRSRAFHTRAGAGDPPVEDRETGGGAVELFLGGEERLDRLAALDPDVDWLELQTGDRAWILQTFLRLRRAGLDVRLTSAPRGRVVVFHAKQWRELERARPHPAAFLVAVRGDVSPAPNADLEIVQNRVAADGGRRLFVPHWPQPALVPRDPSRGATLERAAYKGIRESLHPALREPAWAERLHALGVRWEADETDYRATASRRALLRWPDYLRTDVVLALRPPRRNLHPGKPATKLYNAWLAGVPAILGPEEAYRSERRSELDYLEASGPDEALACLQRLIADPGLYRAMVQRAAVRAREVTPDAVLELWRGLLQEIDERATASARAWRWPRPFRLLGGRIRRARVPR